MAVVVGVVVGVVVVVVETRGVKGNAKRRNLGKSKGQSNNKSSSKTTKLSKRKPHKPMRQVSVGVAGGAVGTRPKAKANLANQSRRAKKHPNKSNRCKNSTITIRSNGAMLSDLKKRLGASKAVKNASQRVDPRQLADL